MKVKFAKIPFYSENKKQFSKSCNSFFKNYLVKPLVVRIVTKEVPLISDRRYELRCESTGSRPAAVISWFKGKKQLKRTMVSLNYYNKAPKTKTVISLRG